MMRLLLVFLVVAGLALAVSGCGRKGTPEPPPDADYPKRYPAS
jgi:predicted small lipoprotein YifL